MQPLIKNELWFALVLVVLLAAYWILYGFTYAKISSPCEKCQCIIVKDLSLSNDRPLLSQITYKGQPFNFTYSQDPNDVQVELFKCSHQNDYAVRLPNKTFLAPLPLDTGVFVAVAAPTFGFSTNPLSYLEVIER